jgi:hypothetical protein
MCDLTKKINYILVAGYYEEKSKKITGMINELVLTAVSRQFKI